MGGVAWLIAVSLTAQLEGVTISDVLSNVASYQTQLLHNALYSLLLHIVLGLSAYAQALDDDEISLQQRYQHLERTMEALEGQLAEARSPSKSDLDTTILQALEGDSPKTVAEICGITGISDTRVRTGLAALVEAQRVEEWETRPRTYSLAE